MDKAALLGLLSPSSVFNIESYSASILPSRRPQPTRACKEQPDSWTQPRQPGEGFEADPDSSRKTGMPRCLSNPLQLLMYLNNSTRQLASVRRRTRVCSSSLVDEATSRAAMGRLVLFCFHLRIKLDGLMLERRSKGTNGQVVEKGGALAAGPKPVS